MSPEAVATDEIYLALKAEIMGGRYLPTATLNAHTIASAAGTSISPVRDAMERLVGERMLTTRPRGGFQVPLVTQASAQDLYQWHAYLVQAATRVSKIPGQPDMAYMPISIEKLSETDEPSLVVATAGIFDFIGRAAGNNEHVLAIRAAGERLSSLRRCERLLKGRREELLALSLLATSGTAIGLRSAIAVYHRRRVRRLPELVAAMYLPSDVS